MSEQSSKHTAMLEQLLELANNYPSPHNGQPIRIQLSGNNFTFYFVKERGLQSTDISYIFSYVTMGVFIQHLRYAARALGHDLTMTRELPSKDQLAGAGEVRFANAVIEWNSHEVNQSLQEALHFRQTSRRKYTVAPSPDLITELVNTPPHSMQLTSLDADKSHQAIWLNQRAVFDDMFDPSVRDELDKWLRYSKREKEQKRDGLAYDAMQLNGHVMKYIVKHPSILRAPLISNLLKQYYLRTMKDRSLVLYMTAPFETEEQSYQIGESIMQIWYKVASARHYLHPFGTIVSNASAHSDFLKLAGITQETKGSNYLVFIFRLGISDAPVRSLRLPQDIHLLKKEDAL